MNIQENIKRIREVMKLQENMKIDDWGRLHDEESKIVYPYAKIAKFLDWYEKEFGDFAKQQGWGIFTSDASMPQIKYKAEPGNKYNYFFEVQRIDDPIEGEALGGKLETDMEAERLAAKTGLMMDEYGVIIGYDGELFI